MIPIANPWHHSVSSSRKWGGIPEDYAPVHNWFDETKAYLADFRHRALRHHAEGIFLMESIFGPTIELSTCARCGKTLDDKGHDHAKNVDSHIFAKKLVPTRWVGEQHVQEDLGFIPPVTMWLEKLQVEPWMNRSRKLSRELEADERPRETATQ